jgi:hypothetical protein
MATEAAWLERKESTGRKEKEKNILHSYRPSHGRTYAVFSSLRTGFNFQE